MKSYRRKKDDYEVRILPDGRLVMLAPDENLIELAKEIEKPVLQPEENNTNKEQNHGTTKDKRA